MKKQYKTLAIEIEEFIAGDVIMASVVIGNGDSTITDEFDDLL